MFFGTDLFANLPPLPPPPQHRQITSGAHDMHAVTYLPLFIDPKKVCMISGKNNL